MKARPPKQPRRILRLVGIGSAAVALLANCAGTPSPDTTYGTTQVATPRLDHIAIVVMENTEYEDVIGSPEMPYLNRLARRYTQMDRMYGISHPSLPNYLALISGDTHGITSDCTDCFIDAPNLVDQLERASVSWRAYMEDMPAPCTLEDVGGYALRHDPFLYFDSVREDADRCSHVVPYDELSNDIGSGNLARLVWVTPNLCHSMHDCPPVKGDAFLSSVVPSLIDAVGSRGIVIVTFDEGTTSEGCCGNASGGHIATVVAGAAARRGFRSDHPYSLYSILRSIEESFGLPLLGEAGCECTLSLGAFIER